MDTLFYLKKVHVAKESGETNKPQSTEWLKLLVSASLTHSGWVVLSFRQFSLFLLTLLIFIPAVRLADVLTEARNTFFVLLPNRLTPFLFFYFKPPSRWARLNEGHEWGLWNITFSKWGVGGLQFSFLVPSHPEWASRAMCQGCLSHVARRSRLVTHRSEAVEMSLIILLFQIPTRLRSSPQRGVIPQCVSHTWMSCWLFFDFRIGRTFLPSTKK